MDTKRDQEAPGQKRGAVIVAHPDDETLWCGGLLLSSEEWDWTIISLCRGSDPDRRPKFFRVLDRLGATGDIGDLDDGPDQAPLANSEVEQTILSLLPNRNFDRILTHGPRGEYTRHRRHEEVCRAVVALWERDVLQTPELWMFAYEDDGHRRLPAPSANATVTVDLAPDLWQAKYVLMSDVYGFEPTSWEARTTPRAEAFRRFVSPEDAAACRQEESLIDESPGSV